MKTESACGPGCNCGAPSGNNKTKIAVSLVVVLGIAGIFIFKAVGARHDNPPNQTTRADSSFSVAQTAPNAVPGVSVQSSNAMRMSKTTASTLEKEKWVQETDVTSALPKNSQKIGDSLDSLSALNNVAMNQDAVFVYIPSKTDEPIDSKTTDAVLSVQKTLKEKSITLGLYTLSTSSPDYPKLSAQSQSPAILVASKGKGTSTVSGEVTETKLLQAYTASSRAGGGCCPSGAKPGAPGCK